MNKLPEISIKDAWLLRENASAHLHKLWAKPNDKLVDDDDMKRIVEFYQNAWSPYEEKILKGMSETFDLEFRHNVIDVYIAPWFFGFSDPLVIGVVHKPDVFIDILTHELLHRLFTANTIYDIDKSEKNLEWRKLFGEEHDFKTLVHIPVHAGLKAIYLDVLNQPQRLQRDIETSQKNPGYKEAWEYVETHDYKELNEKLKNSYQEMKK